jgi:hypothetical protein
MVRYPVRTPDWSTPMTALILTALMWAAAFGHLQTPPAAVSYDTFMQAPPQTRLRTFNAISAENKAALVREHLRRWATKNQARLTAEQAQLVTDSLSLLQADLYDESSPRRPELLEKMKSLEDRIRTLFTVEDGRNAFTIHGDYIPQ